MKRSAMPRNSKARKPVPRKGQWIAPGVWQHPDGREECDQSKQAGRDAYAERTAQMVIRQHGSCAICSEPFNRFSEFLIPTFEHEVGRGMNGAHRDDRIKIGEQEVNAAIHMKCQSKGSVRYAWQGGRYLPVVKEQGRAA